MASFDVPRLRRFTAAAFLALGLLSVYVQQISSADPADQETAKYVTSMIPRHHLNRPEINDQISSKLLDQVIKDLDPQKLYFLDSDIQEFNQYRTKLDDQLKAGNVDFAYQLFDRYKERFAAQTQVAHYWIDQPQDFTIDETIETDPKKLDWCKSQAELNDRWRKRVKYDLLQFKLDNENKSDTTAKTEVSPNGESPVARAAELEGKPKTLEEAKERLHKRYRNNKRIVDQYNTGEELEVYLTALSKCFDPHSSYMSPHSWQDFEIQMKLSLDGIGAALRGEDGYTVVAQIVPGGAAAVDGRLKVGDKITGVGQKDGEIVEVFEMKLSEVVRMIRGERGTIVRLEVQPDKGGEKKIIALTRQKIELKESEVKGEIIDGTSRLGRPGKIGVISLPAFYRDFEGAQGGGDFKSAAADLARVLDQFNKDGVDAVVVDLRNNGGGALQEAIEVSGLFIDRGPVVQVKEPTGYIHGLDDKDNGVKCDKPLIVLCNRLSASASEIFAGVIKDYNRGVIVGDTTTHGKGTVQNLMDVAPRQGFGFFKGNDRGKLKLTIQQFYRVNGDSTQNRGVRSDVVLPSLIDHLELGEEFLDNALPFDAIPAAKYSPNRSVDAETIALLKRNSESRVAANSDFQQIKGAISRYEARKSRTALPLNEDKARAERKADEQAKKHEEKALEDEEAETPKPDGPIFPVGAYNNEVLNIALDYADIMNRKQKERTVAK
ncbi:carboxy terminal-processing peptidase [Planctomicrobium sp. SH664]|uniref:carboxy terminal-processing peptidase n=1 Tax=Planctomicrobium sp. SH664 TaxID=3448125 RepID=UPI003F5C5029